MACWAHRGTPLARVALYRASGAVIAASVFVCLFFVQSVRATPQPNEELWFRWWVTSMVASPPVSGLLAIIATGVSAFGRRERTVLIHDR